MKEKVQEIVELLTFIVYNTPVLYDILEFNEVYH